MKILQHPISLLRIKNFRFPTKMTPAILALLAGGTLTAYGSPRGVQAVAERDAAGQITPRGESRGVAPNPAARSQADYSMGQGWKLVWSDEFNGTSIDTNHWKFETGNHHGWGNHELEYYTGRPENAYVSNGFLHIVARKESVKGFSYTSARMKTEGLFSQKYGRFEFRASFPAGQGFWPAFWLMPEDSPYGGWPECGEIDIVENRGNYPAVVQGTIHYAGPHGEYLDASGLYTFLRNDGATNFHTYDLDWTTNSIQWFVDGNLYETQTNWSAGKAPYPAPFDQPFYIIMNLAVGGNYGGNPDTNTVFPGEVQVDYVRVYKHFNP